MYYLNFNFSIYKMKRSTNLQPWISCFEMLEKYEEKGFLLVEAEKHEAHVTLPALLTMAGVVINPDTELDVPAILRTVGRTVRRLRGYAGWRSQHGGDYLSRPFALHVVKSDYPHDRLHTILLTRRRRWWKLWFHHDYFEVIEY